MQALDEGEFLGPDGLTVLQGLGVVDHPDHGGSRHRGRHAGVVADQAQGGGVDHLTLGLDVSGIEVVGPDTTVAELHGQERPKRWAAALDAA